MSKRAPRRHPSASADKPTIAPLVLIGLLTITSLGLWLWRGSSLKPPSLASLQVQGQGGGEGIAGAARVFQVPKLPAGVVGDAWRPAGDKAQMVRPDGSALSLTLRPGLQEAIAAQLSARKVPYAAVVLMEPSTGAIRAWVEHREAGAPEAVGQGLTRAKAPAASVFKIVTTAALLEAGVRADDDTCYHGGTRGLNMQVLRPSKSDTQCEPLSLSLARSSNVPYGRQAWQKLQPGDLVAKGEDLLFRTLIDFDIEVDPSKLDEGEGALARAKTGAGFRGSTLSPLHGAMLAAAVANDGVIMRPYLVESDTLQPGLARQPAVLQRAMSARTAAEIRTMLARTITEGTGVKAFSAWPEHLQQIAVAGKTGTLASRRGGTYRLYTWFVGYAPADKPEVAIAVLAVNGQAWRAKAAGLARRALTSWFELEKGVTAPPARPEAATSAVDEAKAAGPGQARAPAPASN